MTYQEAIKRLKSIAEHGKDIYLISLDQTALALAVAALERELAAQPKVVEKVAGRPVQGSGI